MSLTDEKYVSLTKVKAKPSTELELPAEVKPVVGE